MKRPVTPAMSGFYYAATALLVTLVMMPALAQSPGTPNVSQPNQSSADCSVNQPKQDPGGDKVSQPKQSLRDCIVSQPNQTPGDSILSQPNQTPTDRIVSEQEQTPGDSVVSQPNQSPTDRIVSQPEQSPGRGLVTDWSTSHVIFSNPGTLLDAMMNGRREEWQRIVTSPRYQMQQIRRNGASPEQEATSQFGFPRLPERRRPPRLPRNRIELASSLHGDWAAELEITGGGPGGVALGMYAAKYTFAPIGSPSCTNDFVVFPINHAGASNQANLLGVKNLYSGFCTTGAVPTVKFAYFVGTGAVQTSPTLSEDGTKVAFVESISAGSKFHVLTLGTTGTNNGTVFNAPVTPCTVNGVPVTGCTTNNAVDINIVMSGGVSVTRSSPFVDYAHDIAYVGDDSGKLHKFTGVFKGTPAEADSTWPFAVAASTVILSGPVFDGGTSQNIFVGGSNGSLYCVTSAGAHCSTPSIIVGTGPILDAPIVDSTQQKVFAAANNTTAGNAVLTQATTALGSQVNVNMGFATTATNGTTDLYNGAFDNAYFTSVSTGHMYFCGNLTGAATPMLYRVGFGATGTMNSTRDSSSFLLVQSGQAGTGTDCTPLTEAFNTSTSPGIDYLFLGVKDHGFSVGTPTCDNRTCVMSFVLTSTFPSAAKAANPSSTFGSGGISGMIIDNVSGTNGASQIYFGNLQGPTGVQASQSALQ
jgi:hypothetical protein